MWLRKDAKFDKLEEVFIQLFFFNISGDGVIMCFNMFQCCISLIQSCESCVPVEAVILCFFLCWK